QNVVLSGDLDVIAPAVLVLAPDAVVISGGVARAGSVLVTAITRHLTDLTLTPPAVGISRLAEGTGLTRAPPTAPDEGSHPLPPDRVRLQAHRRRAIRARGSVARPALSRRR